ncbi:MAG: CDP-glycerol glycerophosphotransferase family protein [Methanobrevibacter sp.]|jgi:CDP-glycerol glycerophosphotransferase (TagB/SpsB family)|nr:CDP-glycerol glycerophosphotransferase family protein [Candidatus Methanovirga aequatorialis]
MMKKGIYYKICGCIGVLNKFIPKKKNKILFFHGVDYLSDNTKALFDYFIKQEKSKNFKIVVNGKYDPFHTKNTDNIKFSSSKNEHLNLTISVFHILTSKFIFFHNGTIPIKPSKEQISVNLGHGTPLKKAYKLLDGIWGEFDFFTYTLASSDNFIKYVSNIFGCDTKKVVVLGHPRNDLLFEDNGSLEKLDISVNFNKVFLWMPTFRISKPNVHEETIVDVDEETFNQTGLPILENEEDVNELNQKLKNLNSFLIIKLHGVADLSYIPIFMYKSLSNMTILTDEDLLSKDVDLYHLIGKCDSLITDYSSVYFDYLLMNRPIGFTVDDMKSYKKNRGFIFDDPLVFMPGDKIYNKYDLFRYIENVTLNKDNYSQQREKISKFANKYRNENSKRLLEKMGLL